MIREDADEVFLPLLDIPDARPALLGLTIADDGRLWAKVTVSPDDSPDSALDDQVSHFWIIDPLAREVAEAVVPANVSISSVRDGVACGVLTTPKIEQLVACYLVGS